MSVWAAKQVSHSGQLSHSQAVSQFTDLSFIPLWFFDPQMLLQEAEWVGR